MTLFRPLTYEEKYGPQPEVTWQSSNSVFISGQANFEDPTQTESYLNGKVVYTTTAPLLNRNGLDFTENNYLSNARVSRDFSINDFSIFNPYIHYSPNPKAGQGMLDKTSAAFEVNTSGFYAVAVSGFNIYSKEYRKIS
jgi:hypothetical protein